MRKLLLFLFAASFCFAGDRVVPGKFIVEPTTLICAGFEWYVEGDDNHNATVSVQFRQKGKKEWKEALPLLRIGHEKAGYPEWNYVTPNMFAGSIFDLEENTEYECRFEITDPDGIRGKAKKMVKIKTRKEPQEYEGGEVRHVYPFKYKGEKLQPAYDGLYHAYYGYRRNCDWILTTDPVGAGDLILVHAGTYKADREDYRDYHGLTFDGTYTLTQDGTPEKPITIKNAGDGEVIFDGNGAHNLFNLMGGDYHIIEGLTIRNTDYGIISGMMNITGSDGLTVRNCQFENIGIGVHGVYEGSKNYYIADNVFIGREDTTALFKTRGSNPMGQINQRVISYYAVKVHGQGHVICHNLVKFFFDGIDVCTHSEPETDQDKKSVSIDIYNNDIFLCNDNFIEADGGQHNIRVLRNRGFNAAQAGWTNQPIFGGPAYWIRNVGFNTPYSSAFKWWGMFPAGVVAYHNTFSTFNLRFFNPCSNVHFRNNLYVPPDDETYYSSCTLYSFTSYSSSDYNGYRMPEGMEKPVRWNTPKEGALRDYNLPNNPTVYQSLEELAEETGQEAHSILVDEGVFEKWVSPQWAGYYKDKAAYPLYYPEQVDFRLRAGAAPIDKGLILPNVNDDYNGNAPDMGAIEYGEVQPAYGPRTQSIE